MKSILTTQLLNHPATEENGRKEWPHNLGVLKTLENEALIAIVSGDLDVTFLAREILADRGFDLANNVIDPKRARKQLLNGQYVAITTLF